MKAKTIWIIVGVVFLILILANWNKIFGKSDKKKYGGQPINDYRVGGVAPGVPPSVPPGVTGRPNVGGAVNPNINNIPAGARGFDDCRKFVQSCSKSGQGPGTAFWAANDCEHLWKGCMNTWG